MQSFSLVPLLVVISTVLGILVLKRFLQLLPYMAQSYFHARGNFAIENSIRVRQDRNLVALVLIVPVVLVVNRFDLYNPAFVQEMSPNLHLLSVAGVLSGYVLLRQLMYVWSRPQRQRGDSYSQAHWLGYTYFVFLALLLLVTAGILVLVKAPFSLSRLILWLETGLVFLVFLFRFTQILSLSCNPLRTFLYLCGLEILPASLLVISALVL